MLVVSVGVLVGAPVVELRDFSHRLSRNGSAMIAGFGASQRLSGRAAHTQEAAFARLQNGAVELLGRDVVGPDPPAVDADPALIDTAPPVARRLAELLREQLRQVHGLGVD